MLSANDDIEALMARLSTRMQLVVLARTWEAIEMMMADEKTKVRIERVKAARNAAGRSDFDL
jgi:hypothetical protein